MAVLVVLFWMAWEAHRSMPRSTSITGVSLDLDLFTDTPERCRKSYVRLLGGLEAQAVSEPQPRLRT